MSSNINDVACLEAEVGAFNTSVQAGAEVGLPERKVRTPFQDKYWSDPVGFAKDCIRWPAGQHLTFYQEEIMRSLVIHKRLAVRGPHGLGKTAFASILILWFALTRDGEDWKVPTTASAWRQLIKYLWPEVHKWARRIRWDTVGRPPFDNNRELQSQSLKLKTGEAFALASNQAELIEGAHADHMLFLFDEAKAIDNSTWDAAEGAFMSPDMNEAYALAISTPGEPVGRFYDIHRRVSGYEDWRVRHVTKDEAIKAGRLSREKCDQRKRQWGEKSAVYQNRVEGNFCASDEDGIIPLTWIEEANERWKLWEAAGFPGTLRSVGGDIARSAEGDKNVIAPVYDVKTVYDSEGVQAVRRAVGLLQKFNEVDTMHTTGRIAAELRKNPGAVGVVDVIGYGGGPVDRLRELKFRIIAFHAQARAEQLNKDGKKEMIKDRSDEFEFANMKSAAWWQARELLDPENRELLALPEDDQLTGDLTAPHWRVTSNGRIEVEGKDDGWPDKEGNPRPPLRQRLGRSPDDGDAVVMGLVPKLWWEEPKVGRSVIAMGKSKGWGTQKLKK